MEEKDTDTKEEIVGIVSMECYFPKLFISQSEYEEYNNVSSGKYTIGLGQKEMSFTSDREDICSICLTVLSNLLHKNNISYSDIGWICVATETIIDHSKSISSSLQQLFIENGNTEIEGIDVKHACYGGTFGLFTAFDRINSKYWDGKYCIVICADIAEYAQGNARCTGGCGAVALLLGKNACIDLNIMRSTYKANEYDFYKPYLNSCYPMVNGHVSNACYLNAFDACYNSYVNKMTHNNNTHWRPFDKNNYWIFHAPYNKLVTKTFGRVMYHDFLNHHNEYYNKYQSNQQILSFLQKYENIACKNTTGVREVIKQFEKMSKTEYNECVLPSTFIPKSVGNCYTASIFMGLMSLIYQSRDDIDNKLLGKNIQMFSYGSGTIASLYSLKIINNNNSRKLLQKILENNNIQKRFEQRTKISCDEFTKITNEKEKQTNDNYENKQDIIPQFKVNKKYFYANTYYLTKIDATKQRFYDMFECEAETVIENKKNINNYQIIKYKNEYVVYQNYCNDNNNNKKKASFAARLGQGMAASAHHLVKKGTDNVISKQGAIKIDKMIDYTQEITTKCSNS